MTEQRLARAQRDRGFALLIVLWSLGLLALVGTTITLTARTELQLARNLRDAAVTEAAADGAVYEAIFGLLRPGRPPTPGAGRRIIYRNVVVDLRAESLAGRVNPNIASPPLLHALLEQVGVDPGQADSLTDAILDWSTPGENARPHGAKAREYQAAGRFYGPPGAPFQNVDELGAVLGMTPELLGLLRPHLTTRWEEEPDPAAADPVVLAALQALGAGETTLSETAPGEEQPAGLMVVEITADAAGPEGSRFVRHAVVAIPPIGIRGAAWRILDWDVPAS